MSKEVNYPSAEGLSLENPTRIDELVSFFQSELDSVSNGQAESACLFEGDIILARNKNHIYQVDIGEGLASDPSALFTRFMRKIREKGDIALTTHDQGDALLSGETDAALHFRTRFPNVEFPVDRTNYLVRTKLGPNLLVYSEKFYFVDALRTPLTWRWAAEKSQFVDLFNIPGKGKERIPVLT